jgi:hypothetical protein
MIAARGVLLDSKSFAQTCFIKSLSVTIPTILSLSVRIIELIVFLDIALAASKAVESASKVTSLLLIISSMLTLFSSDFEFVDIINQWRNYYLGKQYKIISLAPLPKLWE